MGNYYEPVGVNMKSDTNQGIALANLNTTTNNNRDDDTKELVLHMDQDCVDTDKKKLMVSKVGFDCFKDNGDVQGQVLTKDNNPRHRRLASLDVFRGLTVSLMILVDNAGGVFPAINHSPWDGVTLADFVVPFFLFIVGVSIALAYKNLPCKFLATRKSALRALKLLILGLFLQGGFFHSANDLSYGVDLTEIRWMGVLQRIVIAFLLTALCEIWLKQDNKVTSGLSLLRKYEIQWLLVAVLTTVYLSLLYGLYVPDWEYEVFKRNSSTPVTFKVKCGIRGDTGPACNAVALIDRDILGIRHLYKKPIYLRTKQCSTKSPKCGPLPLNAPSWCEAPFDPEGLLSTLMAIVTTFLGLHHGHILVHFKDHWDRISHWLITAASLMSAGLLLNHNGMHLNKALYSLSYTCVTAGAASLIHVVIYVLVDIYRFRRLTLVLEWVAMHALLVYVTVACNIWLLLLQGFYWKEPQNNILKLVGVSK